MIAGAENSKNCAVCLEELDSHSGRNRVTFSCGHVFGRTCAAEWAKVKPQCPLCRHWLTAEDRLALQLPVHRKIHERSVWLMRAFTAIAFCCCQFGGLHSAVRLVRVLVKPPLVAAAASVFFQHRAVRRLSELVIENSPAIVASLAGIPAGVAAAESV